ncbi:hypothetical protein [Glycomyces terrestris]|uniref:Uncharacterized protein n=1 Tax=Glycomyces terrestris TaxID=2493553 RepID=A0A426V4P4_9ACTN|nr:hypothetical protein [Glycomyces terrestris]RRS01853.1 hypothetical protein EIW28_03665 [Glycomyces terrestris]
MCALVDTPFPSHRLNLYTASPEIAWDTTILGGVFDPETGSVRDGFTEEIEDAVLTPGRTERSFPRGPLTAGPADASVSDDGTVLDAAVPLGASLNGERVVLLGYDGDVELRRDGQRLDAVSGIDPAEGFGLALDGAGRHTLAVAGSREPLSGPFAFKSAIDWSFDLDPAADRELVLPAVAVTAPDVVAGLTPNREQRITLHLVSGSGEPVAAADMGFEVSYDYGFTWTPVELDLDPAAGTATAELHHPADATHVSVRTTATDTAGTETSQTTIHAYGLS